MSRQNNIKIYNALFSKNFVLFAVIPGNVQYSDIVKSILHSEIWYNYELC